MAGGAYVALSGLRSRFELLDQLSSDLANFRTTGYKTERSTELSARRPSFEQTLESAVDVMIGPTTVDFTAGTIVPTGTDLDFAIEGSGFFVLETADGPRYTRDGHFRRSIEGILTTPDGLVVQGEDGPIELPHGDLKVDQNGTIKVAGTTVGRLAVVDFENYTALRREGPTRFAANSGALGEPVEKPGVVNGVLEQSNVSLQERLAQVTAVSRSFDALQRGISVLMNDVDGRAISELGRR